MSRQSAYPPPHRKPQKLSWREGFHRYLYGDPHANRLLRHIAVKVVPFLFGVDIVDDVVPVLGQLDDVALPFLLLSIIVMLFKVNRYRKVQVQPPLPRHPYFPPGAPPQLPPRAPWA